MPTPPPLPETWDGLHPLVVHFPVALLLIAPLFVIAGALLGKRSVMVSALVLLLIGTVSSYVATSTGWEAYSMISPDEAMELLDPDGDYDFATEDHGKAAEFTRNAYTAITAAYLIWVLLAFVKPSTRNLAPRLLAGLVFVAALGWAAMLLSDAAHRGGELVHRFGVRAVSAFPDEEEAADEEAAEEEDSSEDGDAGDEAAGDEDAGDGDSEAGGADESSEDEPAQ